MYKFLIKNGQAVAIALGLIVTAVFLISTFTGLSGAGYDVGTDLNKLSAEQKAGINFFNPGLMLTVAMAVIAGVLALVVFGLADLIKFPKSAIKFGLGFIVLLVIFFLLYSTASTEVSGKLAEKMQEFHVSPNVYKLITAGILTTVGLAIAAAVIMVLAEVRNAFK